MNARDASPPGGTIRIRAEKGHENSVELMVTDEGSGIAEDDLPHVFDPFFTTKEQGEGIGLGLAVVYGIVEAHQGTVRVESAAGEGTTFIVTLPLEQEGRAS